MMIDEEKISVNGGLNISEYRKRYEARGYQPLPLLDDGKRPGFKKWNEFPLPEHDVEDLFSRAKNLGLLLGKTSNGLADVDLDVDEALAVAQCFLPRTGMIGGHDRRPKSHYFYQLTNDGKTEKFFYTLDGKETTVAEVRWTGCQTTVAPSRHPDYPGFYRWDQFGEPSRVTYADLILAVTKVVIAATLAQFWPNPGRHNAGLAIAGMLYSCRVSEDDAIQLVEAAARVDGHERVEDRVRTVRDTYRNARNGKPTRGIPSLVESFPEKFVDKITQWCRRIATEPREKIFLDDAREPATEQKKDSPWLHIKTAPVFLAEEEKEFRGLAKDLLAPGAITLLAAPRGLGKTQVTHAVGNALAQGGIFRGEQLQKVRVLLVDRDNPESVIKKRLRSWGAIRSENLHILTRQHAPDLKNREAWAAFPVENYDVLIIDSVGASTEGVTEKEGKQTTEILATVLDLARKGIAILLLSNTTKDALNLKGRGEWSDRADIIYEIRDATGFIPSGKKPWWQELPEAGEAAWADRAARRKGRIDFRLAFVCSKFRLGPEPDPFCLELHLPEGEPWTLRDATNDIVQAGEDALEQAKQQKTAHITKAAESLAQLVSAREKNNPVLKTEAEKFLKEGHNLKRAEARELLDSSPLWQLKNISSGESRGARWCLFSPSAATLDPPPRPLKSIVSDTLEVAVHNEQGRQLHTNGNAYSDKLSSDSQESPNSGERKEEAAATQTKRPGFYKMEQEI